MTTPAPTAPLELPAMTLRDWFAGQAIAGGVNGGTNSYISDADEAYKFADAMMEVRTWGQS